MFLDRYTSKIANFPYYRPPTHIIAQPRVTAFGPFIPLNDIYLCAKYEQNRTNRSGDILFSPIIAHFYHIIAHPTLTTFGRNILLNGIYQSSKY